MNSRNSVAALVALGVLLTWVYSVGHRLPYMNQIPVFDADVTTAAARMAARIWWDEGARHLWFAIPRTPLSIETPTLASRVLYESWPPGAIVPIYAVASFLGMEPSIPLVNWINTVQHGLIALAAAFIAFNIARQNRLDSMSSGLIALAVAFPILLSRGLIYAFSQIYDVVTAVLIYTTVFLLLEVLFYGARAQREKWIITALQLVTIFCAFFVDWLSYTLFAFWIVSRVVAGYLGIEPRMTLHRLVSLALLPVCSFSMYMIWRIFAPGSLASIEGPAGSVQQLGKKILQRMNLTGQSPVDGFVEVFFQTMHQDYYSQYAFLLIVVSTLATLTLLVVSFRRTENPFERRSIFAAMSILALVTIPFYLHMIVFYQHTFIHRWAITKAMFAYALIPFALLPIAVFVLIRRPISQSKASFRRVGLVVIGLLLASCALNYAVDVTRYDSYALRGRIDRNAYLMWDDIGRNTVYKDVVVSPVLEANPFSVQVGTAYKLVHHADNFADVDKVVTRVCGDFNVVVALPKGSEPGEFSSREPAQVIDTGRIRLLRFASYPGKAVDCPR
jgi:hypothetical protein